MGRIFISAGHGAGEPGGQAGGTTEAQEMILLRDQIVPELRSRGFEVLSVPDDQNSTQSISWINARSRSGDVALEIHADAYSNPATRGATVFYISSNEERKQNAELLLLALLRRVPQLPSRGVKPDTATGVGRLSFCRDTFIPSLLMEVGYLTNPDDRFLIQNRRRDIALGIADGLASWSRGGTPTPDPGTSPTYPSINININNQVYGEKGVLINSNAYIPIDLVDRLSIDLTNNTSVRRVSYRGVVYIKAIELRPFNISVGWDSATRTLSLRSILPICPGQLDRIMGYGNTSEVQMIMFLKANNENALAQFPDLPKLYREEATIEGVNYDIAFCQMCVETGFLRFGGDIKPSQNNFAALGSIGGASESATFPSARIGVRAHIQHLKAYASLEPLVQELVDPRFRFVTRGVAPLISQLSGRWAADPQYGTKIEATLRRLYESAGFL
ncbi:N-acetylmuramoyl-L-alanine amidase [Coleofasciculus sp. FACHB-SPT36]|uniref:hormogonium tapered terminus morphoprotein TftA n=1 Tax=Cyanophyceae TaxID=3028117 RepID=UPI00168A444D|nr:N-acetylmuramoyl-L-alanine amidase [Coleofasciculus sp. FACHB-SPT36]MBD2537414.1 N-acetylmuramoyl-L-alanine amidase [Coleofasciculus sp. FACHB-SPT36]